MKNTLYEPKLMQEFTVDEKTQVLKWSMEGLAWMEGEAGKAADDMDTLSKKKQLETKFNPVMMRVYEKTAGQ